MVIPTRDHKVERAILRWQIRLPPVVEIQRGLQIQALNAGGCRNCKNCSISLATLEWHC